MKNKTIYELGILAQKGDEMAMLEIIERKKKMLKSGRAVCTTTKTAHA